MNIVEFDQECTDCGGTGLYIGMAERDGAAVICHKCRGTGCKHVRLEYEPFHNRHTRTDVDRVYQSNPGIMIGKGGGKYALSDFGGITYAEWLATQTFPKHSENRLFTCPRWWTQSIGGGGIEWKDWPCTWGRFSDCPQFLTKDRCWSRYDKESAK